MSEHAVRSVLRIIAVTTVLIGAILTTGAVFGLIGLDSSVRGYGVHGQGMPALAQALLWGHSSIMLWGLLLYVASTPMARQIVR
ncbi:hypothetical protein [Halomonas denitrificans]|nr:hypothetical protein [Halomonas denitrificans]